MPYAPSVPLLTWLGRRRDAIKAVAAAHAAIGEVAGPGRPLEAGRPVGNMYVIRVVAEFQGFVRDVYDLAAERTVALAAPDPRYVPLLIEAMTSGRRIDQANADLRGMTQDFRRLGITGLAAGIGARNSWWSRQTGRSDQAYYQDLIELRNALAHGNQGQVDRLRARGVADTVGWARARLPGLDRTARAVDRVVWDHLVTTFGVEPW